MPKECAGSVGVVDERKMESRSHVDMFVDVFLFDVIRED